MSAPKKNLIMTKANKIIALFLTLLLLAPYAVLSAPISAEKRQTAYVVYDSPVRFGGEFPMVDSLIEYLGHFDLNCRSIQVDSWQPGDLQGADLVIYVGMQDKRLAPALLQEIAQAKRVVWFEKNIEQLAAQLQWRDFALEGVSSGWSYFHYKKEHYLSDWLPVVIAQPGTSGEILATVSKFGLQRPLVWRRDNVYFCGLLSVDSFFMPTLGDLLHTFIPNDHQAHKQTLLRIEDVNPSTDPKTVAAIVEKITAYKLPFAIGVIPVAVDKGGKHTYLHDAPQLLSVLQAAQGQGASIIMHGYTHQNDYSPKTGEGYEFWNARDDKPMEDDDRFTSERLEAGIAELVRCGLIPVAFEPPHYAMSAQGYKTLSRYFNIFSGQIQISDKSDKISLMLPYMTRSSYLNGMTVIPENMGYYDGKQFLAEDMLQCADDLLDVPDALAGFFYHGYLPADKLPFIIEGLRRQNYEFLDLRKMPVRVTSAQISIVGRDGTFDVQIDEALRQSWADPTANVNSLVQRIGKVYVAGLAFVLAAFLAIILHLRKNAHRHYEK